MRSDTFGRLLKAGIGSIATCEGKTAPVVEDELGQRIGVTAASIQRYKSGHIPPELRNIELLASACVNRGYLNREWLQSFLRAAHYPAPEKLIDKLCPIGPTRERPAHVYQNLPAPTYSQFVMRAQPFAEVLDGLAQRSALVLIASLGGMGKTSLAREVAARCLQADGDGPRFDAAVWVSDKDRPGATNLSIVLDEIARTLDYPGFTQFEHEEKRREVEQLLRRQKVLLVVDNFETITDGALLAWLLRLPEPSKAIVTSREYSRSFRNNTFVVDLRGMSEAEAQEFIGQRLQFLKIERLVSDRSQLDPLVAATGGNPKAIELALGIVKHERRPLQHVVDDLYAARGELFDDLFTRAWALLDEAARRVLLVMTFFPDSAGGEALAATADVQGFAFDRAVERLMDLALLDAQQADLTSPPRYLLHPLVRAFAGARIIEAPEFEMRARERWVGWYIQLASQVGACWNNLSKLELLDPEQEAVYIVVTWLSQKQRYAETIELIDGIRYYYSVRGSWDKQHAVILIRVEAAQKLSDKSQEARSLAYYVGALVKQGNLIEAEKFLQQLRNLAQSTQLPESNTFRFHYAAALYSMTCGELDHAQEILQNLLPLSVEISSQAYVVNRRWLATCLYHKGKLTEAQQLFRDSMHDAEQIGDQRSIIGNKIRLAAIDLDRGNLEEAAEALEECSVKAYHYQDRRRLSEIQPLYIRLHTLRGDLPAARAALTEAIDLFERLGMRRELAEARAELVRLDDTMIR